MFSQFNDNYEPPYLIVLPTNLQYLVDFEKQNRRERRRAGAKTGLAPQRKMPTGFDYLTAGGLYKPIEVKPCILVDIPQREECLRSLFRPKVWNGAPFAILRYVFPLMKNESCFDAEVRSQLKELYDLYFDDEVDERDEDDKTRVE